MHHHSALRPDASLFIGASIAQGAAEPCANDAESWDRVLIGRLVAGDVRALDDVLARLWSPVVAYVFSILRSRDAADDIAQEAFYRVWERRAKLDVNGSLRGLVYQTARNLAVSELRRIAASERVARALRDEQDVSLTIDIRDDEVHGALNAAVRDLPLRRREILVLHVVHELSYKEVAELMGIAPQTVANQFSMALASLRQTLGSAPVY